jgi:hypothetical protein
MINTDSDLVHGGQKISAKDIIYTLLLFFFLAWCVRCVKKRLVAFVVL